MQKQVTCKCGKVFMARVADLNRGWAKSCSKSCAAKAMGGWRKPGYDIRKRFFKGNSGIFVDQD